MDKNIFEGNWKKIRGRVKEKWGELTDNEVAQIEGKKDVLAGKLQKKYGMTRMEAEKEINDFLAEIDV